MTSLNILKEKIECLSKFHQIEILKILNQEKDCTINENKNGIFINLTHLSKDIIQKLIDYLEYVHKQEKQLIDIENEKTKLTNTYFKDNKDNVGLNIDAK
tara:strand:- start:6737 stop:7036 length:300 start_codon:yes stop_codon:yes gene_type:complete